MLLYANGRFQAKRPIAPSIFFIGLDGSEEHKVTASQYYQFPFKNANLKPVKIKNTPYGVFIIFYFQQALLTILSLPLSTPSYNSTIFPSD
ncbi:hypothetical protein EGI32_09485 [Ferruginibacter sp. HRS2-29]|nr:hypothetical protein [Ferruginibacter sp. HRS2-29]